MSTTPTKARQRAATTPPTTPAEDLAVARRKARLRELIEREGAGGAASLARRAGRSQAGINHMAKPGYEFGVRAARSLEDSLGLPFGYFDMLDAPGAAPGGVRMIPVLEWGRIGRYQDSGGVSVPCPWAVGPRAVAAVAKQSMWGGEGLPGIPQGWAAIIDPDAATREGDVVCVWTDGATEATLRQYVCDGGSHLLYPLDRRLPIAHWTKTTMVVGPVIGALRHFRG